MYFMPYAASCSSSPFLAVHPEILVVSHSVPQLFHSTRYKYIEINVYKTYEFEGWSQGHPTLIA